MNRKINFPWWFLIILLVAFAVGYWAWSESLRDPEIQNSPFPSFEKRGEGGEFEGWKTYRNEEYGFEFRYPSDWAPYNFSTVKDDKESFIPSNYVSRCFTKSDEEYSCLYFRIIDVQERITKYSPLGGDHEIIEFDVEKLPAEKIGIYYFKIADDLGEGGLTITEFYTLGPDGKYHGLSYQTIFLDPKLERHTLDQILSTFRFIDSATAFQLGQEFTLRKGQGAAVGNLKVTVTDFIYSPCPEGAVCVWSGLGINFEYEYNGQKKSGLNLYEAFGYKVTVVNTDYKTFATLVVNK